MNVYRLTFLICLITLIYSCEVDSIQHIEEEPIQEELYYNVDQGLWTHFQQFEREAAKRGHNYNLDTHGTTGEISVIPEDGVAGTCQYGNHINHVTVDVEFWDRASNLLREFVVFHELGHCVLARGHEESSFSNGICRSIMRSGTQDCIDAYIAQNRDYYLDELFSMSN